MKLLNVNLRGLTPFIVLVLLSCDRPLLPTEIPRDQNLIALFSTHHEEFEKLRKMADEDGRTQYFIYAFDTKSRLARSHQQEYDDLLPRIGPGIIVVRCDNGIIRFIIAKEGISIGPEREKGIVYIPGDYEKHGVIVHDLDDVSKFGCRTHLRKLEPNWFLFYQDYD